MRTRALVLLALLAPAGLVAEEVIRTHITATIIRRDCRLLTPGERLGSRPLAGFHFKEDVRKALKSAARACKGESKPTPGGSIIHDVPYRGLCGCTFELKPCTAEIAYVDEYTCMGLD
jgi:hypothetical protein